MSDHPLTNPPAPEGLLELAPRGMKSRPVYAGLPVPYVSKLDADGVPVGISKDRLQFCWKHKCCPWCGNDGKLKHFVLVTINSIAARIAEMPPMHMTCALWAAQTGPWGEGTMVTTETHGLWKQVTVPETAEQPAFDVGLLDCEPVAAQWWCDGQPVDHATADAAMEHWYSTQGTDIPQNVEERGGMEHLFKLALMTLPPVDDPPGQGENVEMN